MSRPSIKDFAVPPLLVGGRVAGWTLRSMLLIAQTTAWAWTENVGQSSFDVLPPCFVSSGFCHSLRYLPRFYTSVALVHSKVT